MPGLCGEWKESPCPSAEVAGGLPRSLKGTWYSLWELFKITRRDSRAHRFHAAPRRWSGG